MKSWRSMISFFLLAMSCTVMTSKPKDEAQMFVDIQAQTPRSFEADGNWTALGKIADTAAAAKNFKGDTLLQGVFRFIYDKGDFRLEMYRAGGTAVAFAINHQDTFSLFSYLDDATILTTPDGSLVFLGVGLRPRDFPLVFLLFPTPTPADSFYYSGGNIIYTAHEAQISVNPTTRQISNVTYNNVELAFQGYRKIGGRWRPFLVTSRGVFPVVNRVNLSITKQILNPKLRPELFSARPPATKRLLNFLPKAKKE